jgi:hypothetical protein
VHVSHKKGEDFEAPPCPKSKPHCDPCALVPPDPSSSKWLLFRMKKPDNNPL